MAYVGHQNLFDLLGDDDGDAVVAAPKKTSPSDVKKKT